MDRGRNWTAIWKTPKVIYSLMGWDLKGPVSFRFLFGFGGTFMAVLIAQVSFLHWFMDFSTLFITKFIVFPVFVGLASGWKRDRRSFYHHLRAVFQHRKAGKDITAYRVLEVDGNRKVKWSIPYRTYQGGESS